MSSIAMTNDNLVNLDHLNKIIKVNKEKKQITFESGIRLFEINQKIEKYNLAFSNLGQISEQSLAGRKLFSHQKVQLKHVLTEQE
jgi:FAD/FMN-containing dehydrogenase